MASPAYYVWVGGGKPYRLCRPAAALQSALRGHGLTVYDYPDDSHLLASTPEDHTPFSATGWPGQSAYGIGHAIDIMPRADTAAGRAENAAIARKLIADRTAGVPGVAWIKYLNWTDESGVCRQERWMPSHETRSSTDKGHIHVSARSDCDTDARADGYDPLGGDMLRDETIPGTSTPGMGDRNAAILLSDIWNVVMRGRTQGGGLWGDSPVAKLLAAAGQPVSVVLADAQVTALAEQIGGHLVASPDTPLGDADKPAIVAAVKQALAEGVGSA